MATKAEFMRGASWALFWRYMLALAILSTVWSFTYPYVFGVFKGLFESPAPDSPLAPLEQLWSIPMLIVHIIALVVFNYVVLGWALRSIVGKEINGMKLVVAEDTEKPLENH